METNQNLKRLTDLAKRTPVRTPDYLSTRVLAHYETQSVHKRLRIWKLLATAFGLSAVVLVSMFTMKSDPSFQASVFQPHVVRVQVDAMPEGQVVEAQITLPQGVEFYSASFPELSAERQLVMDVSLKDGKLIAPFVVRGHEQGRKKVKIHFLNDKQQVVMEKTVDILFQADAS